MAFSWPILLLAVALGVVQLAAGIVFGRFLTLGRRASGRHERRNVRRLRQFAGRLFELVNSVADDVDQCQSQIEEINKELASLGPRQRDPLAEFVLKLVARILEINHRLQNRLANAETRLTDQARLIETQLAEARTDALTGLPNRRAFDDELGRRLAEWNRTNAPFSLMMIDIDHFKALNDRHGHPAGDAALRSIAEVLENTLREMDLIARVGGEEFAAILPSTNLAEGCRASERIRAAVARHRIRFEGVDLQMTVSVGLVSAIAGDNAASLIKRADAALYTAKRSGRNCGYYHNGQTFEPIDRSKRIPSAHGQAGQTSDGLNDEGVDELTALGAELRDRLAEVAGVELQ